MSITHATYLHNINKEGLPKTVTWLVRMLRKGPEFDAIAVRGFSGAIPGSIVAYMMRKPLIVVRKDKTVESTHGGSIEVLSKNPLPPKTRYVFLDDQISGGTTRNAVIKSLELLHFVHVGNLLYNTSTYKNDNGISLI